MGVIFHVATERGTAEHGAFLDAFLEHAGFVLLEGRLVELLCAYTSEGDAFTWAFRFARYAGRA
jgi:hypothetical protein